MKYVMSDIHGNYEKYRAMLFLINFNEEDDLYILGDVVDRGEHGMKVLQHMMEHSNIIPILGNHELMAYQNLKWLAKEITEESLAGLGEDRMQHLLEWMGNGGGTTLREFRALSPEERQEILEYFREFWGFVEVEAGGWQYLLVHAGFETFEPDKPLETYGLEELVWARMDVEKTYFKDRVIVFGHTPTRHFYAQKQGKLLSQLSKEELCDEVYESEDGMLLGIDCACGFDGRLGCVCLDTRERFYV